MFKQVQAFFCIYRVNCNWKVSAINTTLKLQFGHNITLATVLICFWTKIKILLLGLLKGWPQLQFLLQPEKTQRTLRKNHAPCLQKSDNLISGFVWTLLLKQNVGTVVYYCNWLKISSNSYNLQTNL